MRLIRLQDDRPDIGPRGGKPGQQAERPGRRQPRFQAEPAAQAVVDGVQRQQLLGHAAAGDVQHAPGDHPPDLARTVHVHGLYRPAPAQDDRLGNG